MPPFWPQMYERALSNGPFQTKFLLPDGRVLDVTFSPIVVGGAPAGVSVFGKDVTETEKAEVAIANAERKYRSIFNGALEGMFQTTVDGRTLAANPSLARMLGYDSAESFTAATTDWAHQVWADPADRARFMQELEDTGELRGSEQRFKRRDGTILWVSANCRQTFAADGLTPVHEGFIEDITERRRAAAALALSEARFTTFFDSNGSVMLLIDPSTGAIRAANQAAAAFYGYAQEELVGMPIRQLNTLPPEELRATFQRLLNREANHFYFRHRLASGEEREVGVYTSLIEAEGTTLVSSIIHDVTDRKNAADALRKSEERYRAAFETSLDALAIVRISDAKIIEVNQALLDILGYERHEVVGRTTLETGLWADLFDRQRLLETVIQNSYCRDMEFKYRKKNGETIWGLTSASIVDFDGEPCTLAVTRDMSEAKAAENTIKDLAFYDPLTHLPNRRLLRDRLQQTLVSSARSLRKQALLFVNLDEFKMLNDTLGHQAADLLLVEVARRMTGCLHDTDTVARLGSDEFAVILEDLDELDEDAATQARQIAERLLACVRRPYMLEGHRCHCTASIGISVFGDKPATTNELMQQADIALSNAKSAGRNTFRFFSSALQDAVNARAELEGDLRRAIEGDEFLLHYQPQMEGGQITGAEALVRWQHPRRNLVSPSEFIPMAEETGLILPLGDWVIETACAQIAAWAAQTETSDLTLAVNISARQLRRTDFAEHILGVLSRTGARGTRLRLELTESSLLDDIEGTIAKMARLKAEGVRFCLDDFGTGYSSLSYLKRLPLDRLKIDRAFVRDILEDVTSGAIAQTIISLSRAMGLGVIAEGVETEEQRLFLAGMGCESYQGYLFSRPVPIVEFQQLLSGPAESALLCSC
jgi:diguanylate cyclase (GGDEF)-like protein/PAS domain S-box-containing protein